MSSDMAALDKIETSGWKQVELGKIVRIVTDGISAADLSALPEVRHYSLPAFDLGAGPEIGPGGTIKSNKTIVPDDCVLFSKLNPRIPRIWRVGGIAAPHSYCSTEFWPLVAQGACVDLDYLTQYLRSESFLGHPSIAPSSSTNSHQRVDRKAFERFEFLLPPLAEQQRIAKVLRSVDDAIAANEAVAMQARRAYQSTLAELVGSGHDHWETVRLGQIATFVNGRGFKPHEWGEEGLPIIRIQNLNGGTDFNYYSGDFNSKILVCPGDLLFAWSGSRGTSFGPHIWRGPQGVLNYHTWNVLPNEPEDRDYLYFALRHLTKKIEDEAHGASALVHMQKAYVVDYEISLPPPEERHVIASTLIDLQEAAANADTVYREAQAMKAHLMADLLSGHVRVPA